MPESTEPAGAWPLSLAHVLQLFSLCDDLVCAHDADGQIVLANPAFERALGYTHDELVAARFTDLIPAHHRAEAQTALSNIPDAPDHVRLNFPLLTKTGEEYAVEWNAKTDPQSKTIYCVGRNITSLQKMQAALIQSEQRAQALFDHAAQGILAIDAQGIIRLANPMMESLFGYPSSELIGMSLDRLVPENLRSAHKRHRRDFFDTPRSRPMGEGRDLTAIKKSGERFPVEISLGHIRSGDDLLAVAFVSDISERIRSREEKRELERRLTQATKMEAVGRLAGGIAHDFNNLLTALTGFSEIVLDYVEEDHPLRQGAEQAFKTCQRSAALIRQLLAVSKRQILRPTELNLNHKLRELDPMLRGLLAENIALVLDLDDSLGPIRVDESQIEQVVLNLVVNGRDAMPNGGTITLTTSQRSAVPKDDGSHQVNNALLVVSDTGEGMEPDVMERIFEPFFTTKDLAGTGLGLSTAYGVVQQSGGTIQVKSEPGSGTTFEITLPLFAEKPRSRTRFVNPGDNPRGSESILLVEDEAAVRTTTKHTLEKMGYHVVAAASPDEALALFERDKVTFDLLLSDVVMPAMNGTELARLLRKRDPSIKVLFMSGHADDALLHQGFAAEENLELLEKPFDRRALTRKVRDSLDKE